MIAMRKSLLIGLALACAAISQVAWHAAGQSFSVNPSDPTRAIVGASVNLTWNYVQTDAVTFRKWSYVQADNIVIVNIMTKVGVSAADSKGDYIGRINYHAPATIIIDQLALSDEGFIACVIEFEGGLSLFSKRLLEIGFPARITASPLTADIVLEGGTTNLSCEADGRHQPTVQWLLNGVILSPGGRISIVETDLGITDNKTTIKSDLSLGSADQADMGNITCVATNDFGSDRFDTAHVVYFSSRATTLTSDQANNEGALGQPVVITCSAQGNPAVYYPLYKDNVLIRNTTSGVLTFASSTVQDEATYKCIPINYLGSGSPVELTLVIVVPPILQMSTPTPHEVSLGDTVELKCVFYGDPQPVITWYRTGQSLPASSSDASSTMSQNASFTTVQSILTISNAAREDYGQYMCNASNAVGNNSKAITLDVRYAPIILNGSFDAEYTLDHDDGGVLPLICTVDGNPRATVTWFKSTTQLAASSEFSIEDIEIFNSDNHVTINNTLTLQGWNKTRTGMYKCSASNGIGVSERTTNIEVRFAPEVATMLAPNVTVSVGGPLVLFCKFKSKPHANVTWTKDGVELGPPTDITTSITEQAVEGGLTFEADASSTLAISSAQRGDYGVYRCNATNILGSAYSETTAIINFAPVITGQSPLVMSAVEAEAALVLHCQWLANPPPVVTWKKDGVVVNASSNVNMVTLSSSSRQTEVQLNLTLTSLVRGHSGNYTCEATNSLGTVSILTAVTVFYPPGFAVPLLGNLTLNTSDSLTLECAVIGNPQPSIVWLKDGQLLTPLAPLSITHWAQQSAPFEFTVRSNLTLVGVAQMDAGVYSCRANNSVNSIEQHSTVAVNYVPIITASFGAEENYTETSALFSLQCIVDSHPSASITWTKDDSPVATNTNETLVAGSGGSRDKINSRLFFPSGLARVDFGEYKCSATNLLGTSLKSVIVNVVYAPESFAAIVSFQNATKGTSVTFTCKVRANPPPSVTWYKGLVPIVNGVTLTTLSQSRSATDIQNVLVLNNLDKSDTESYTCKAENSVSQLPQTVFVNVQYRPELLVASSSHTLNETTSVSLSCSSDANPNDLSFEWKKNGVLMTSAQSASLVLSNAHENTIGVYECTPINSMGRGETVVYNVLVKVPPQVVSHAQCTEGTRNDSSQYFNCTCQGRGTPFPSVSWTKHGSPIVLSNSTTLIIEVGNNDIDGTYKCHFENSAGTTTSNTGIALLADKYTQWNTWSTCNNTCGDGVQKRERICNIAPCTDPITEYQGCIGVTCPDKLTEDEESWLIALYVLIPLLLVLCILLILWLSRLNRNNDEKPVMVPVNNNISKPPSVRSVPTRQEIYLPSKHFGVLNAGYRPDSEQARRGNETESIEVEMNFDTEGPESETDNNPFRGQNGDAPSLYDHLPPTDYDLSNLDMDLEEEQESIADEDSDDGDCSSTEAPPENHYMSPPPPIIYPDESSTYTSL